MRDRHEGGPPPPGSEAGSAERSCVQSPGPCAFNAAHATRTPDPPLDLSALVEPQRSATCASSGAARTARRTGVSALRGAVITGARSFEAVVGMQRLGAR